MDAEAARPPDWAAGIIAATLYQPDRPHLLVRFSRTPLSTGRAIDGGGVDGCRDVARGPPEPAQTVFGPSPGSQYSSGGDPDVLGRSHTPVISWPAGSGPRSGCARIMTGPRRLVDQASFNALCSAGCLRGRRHGLSLRSSCLAAGDRGTDARPTPALPCLVTSAKWLADRSTWADGRCAVGQHEPSHRGLPWAPPTMSPRDLDWRDRDLGMGPGRCGCNRLIEHQAALERDQR